jgi:hypothetical protein
MGGDRLWNNPENEIRRVMKDCPGMLGMFCILIGGGFTSIYA